MQSPLHEGHRKSFGYQYTVQCGQVFGFTNLQLFRCVSNRNVASVRVSKTGALGEIGKGQRPLTDIERELAKVKRELSLAKMERDILKKAAAYFAKESLEGTR